eukprot:PhM_4_TR9143/c0_g1_i1/m.90203
MNFYHTFFLFLFIYCCDHELAPHAAEHELLLEQPCCCCELTTTTGGGAGDAPDVYDFTEDAMSSRLAMLWMAAAAVVLAVRCGGSTLHPAKMSGPLPALGTEAAAAAAMTVGNCCGCEFVWQNWLRVCGCVVGAGVVVRSPDPKLCWKNELRMRSSDSFAFICFASCSVTTSPCWLCAAVVCPCWLLPEMDALRASGGRGVVTLELGAEGLLVSPMGTNGTGGTAVLWLVAPDTSNGFLSADSMSLHADAGTKPCTTPSCSSVWRKHLGPCITQSMYSSTSFVVCCGEGSAGVAVSCPPYAEESTPPTSSEDRSPSVVIEGTLFCPKVSGTPSEPTKNGHVCKSVSAVGRFAGSTCRQLNIISLICASVTLSSALGRMPLDTFLNT